MIVICGFTPRALGTTLPSETQRLSAPWTFRPWSTTPWPGCAWARAVPSGWKAISLPET
jgi:hypothetical protein